ncbi:MAG: geranylgeranylglycerol-phosphate geranylgeranyltransferase [Chitinophagaceae bacterium]
MKSKIHIVRPYNLLIIAATMIVLLVKYRNETLDNYWLKAVLLIIPAVLTAAAGYVVNDIYDVETDKINKPEKLLIDVRISKSNAWKLYALLNISSLCVSYFFSQQYMIINLSIIGILYLYSIQLKGTPLIGNIIVAMCSAAVIATCILLVNFEVEAGLLNFTGYVVFSFFISLIREIVKDMQDMEGDKAAGYTTYPVLIGARGAKILVYVLCGIEIMLCGIYSFLAWGIDLRISSVIMGLITIALFYFINQLARAKTKEDFASASHFLKFVMFAGVLNIPFC